MFHRSLALPMSGVVLLTVAVTASSPTTPFLIAVLAIVMIAFTIAALAPQWRRSGSLVSDLSPTQQKRIAAMSTAATPGVPTRVEAAAEVEMIPSAVQSGTDSAPGHVSCSRVQ